MEPRHALRPPKRLGTRSVQPTGNCRSPRVAPSLLKGEKKENRNGSRRVLPACHQEACRSTGQTSGYSVRCGTQDGLSESCEDSPAACQMETDIVNMESDLRALLTVHAKEHREQAKQNHRETVALVSSLGHNGMRYRREATTRLRAVVSEIYSAPRVADMARRQPRLGAIPGVSLDLTGTDERKSVGFQRKRTEGKG